MVVNLKLMVRELFTRKQKILKKMEMCGPLKEYSFLLGQKKFFLPKTLFFKIFASINNLENIKTQKHPNIAPC